uniref:Uncharacterized protein n=1 Tax=Hyaloperonospora arabidopsidis (strain Emoy2) TaxID=559515 RepID=M4C206_HYAAE
MVTAATTVCKTADDDWNTCHVFPSSSAGAHRTPSGAAPTELRIGVIRFSHRRECA